MSDDAASKEIIVRKVRVLEPMLGEIEVTVDIGGIIDKIVSTVAIRAYRNATGAAESVTNISLLGKATLTPDTVTTRNAYLRLNNVPRESVTPAFEVIPP